MKLVEFLKCSYEFTFCRQEQIQLDAITLKNQHYGSITSMPTSAMWTFAT